MWEFANQFLRACVCVRALDRRPGDVTVRFCVLPVFIATAINYHNNIVNDVRNILLQILFRVYN